MYEQLTKAAAECGDRPAILQDDRQWSYVDVLRLTDEFADDLVHRGLETSDRVAVMTANRVEFVAVVHALDRLGVPAVLLSPAWRDAEVAHALALTSPRLAVADGENVAILRSQLDDGAVVDLDVPRPASPARPHGGGSTARAADESVLVFSSGTTGLPKAVRHTRRSIAVATEHWCDAHGLGPDDRFQVATPPSHILGLLNLLAAVHAGATVRLHRRFDLDEILRRISEERMTLEMAVAPIAYAMANHPRLESYDLSSLRYVMWCATPVSESVARTVAERTGIRWLTAYGASELPVISANPVDDPASWRIDSAGLPVPGVEVRVVDLESGAVLPSGEVGEIQVRSASRMEGYVPEEATADVIVDGWYRTGDVGWMEPDGWIHLTERAKEMIKVLGFQVAPAELENVLLGHPAVADCAVFGVPDDRAGEVPAAAIELTADGSVSEQELIELVAATLASYKRLHHVVIVDAIPRLPSGKVLRRALRDRWAVELVSPRDAD